MKARRNVRCSFWNYALVVAGLSLGMPLANAVTVVEDAHGLVVSGSAYRLHFQRESPAVAMDLREANGQWLQVAGAGAVTYARFGGGQPHEATGNRATWAMVTRSNEVVAGQQILLGSNTLELHYVCRNEGVLLGARYLSAEPAPVEGVLWAPPRLALNATAWDEYLFWGADDQAHSGRLEKLQPTPAFAGVSPWEQGGDTVRALSSKHPALLVRSVKSGIGLGVVLLDYPNHWPGAASFLQRHTPQNLYFYTGYLPASQAGQMHWTWLAPFEQGAPAKTAIQVEALVQDGLAIAAQFKAIAPPVPDNWRQPPLDFPAQLRSSSPRRKLQDMAVFSMNEPTTSDYALDLARRSGSDFLIRGWFKWAQAPQLQSLHEIPERAHRLGAWFGGGITCSALYDTENGLTPAQVHDMATRDPAGELVDAWDTPGVRHGSLSSSAYLDYLFRWCREQIDAGVDYLFMDEHTAALSGREGYDDHSLADFRQYLLEFSPLTREWKPNDPRWTSQYKIDLRDPAICRGGSMSGFDYRAFMRAKGFLKEPGGTANPLASLWHSFRAWRDDRAWKSLTDRIRAYAREHGRTVWLSANGLARYVDLQVLGIWDLWLVKNDQVDLSQNQLQTWRDLVVKGRELTDQTVPVIFFHDWGMGDTPFPWMAVPPSQREIWLRTRAAEIYAAGGFFAFPVLGPFGCDSGRDGSIATITRQAIFYQTQRNLYLHGRFLGIDSVQTDHPALSLAAWAGETPNTVVLHVINRLVQDGQLQPRSSVNLTIPLNALPDTADAISPDWPGTRPVSCVQTGNQLRVSLAGLEAYAVVRLHYQRAIDLTRLVDPIRIRMSNRWERPARSEFTVQPDGLVEHSDELNALLQGRLHNDLVNPPTFVLNREGPTTLTVHVRAVAVQGARLAIEVDGKVERTVDLPDRDGKNDGNANEYDQSITLTIPPGAHRVTLKNPGGDWLVMDWLAFASAGKN